MMEDMVVMNNFYVGDVVKTIHGAEAVVVMTDQDYNGWNDDGVVIRRDGVRDIMVHKGDLVLVKKVDPKEYLRLQVAEAMGDTLVCTRTWSAWGYGTMSEEDFYPAGEENDLVDSIVETVIQSLSILNRK